MSDHDLNHLTHLSFEDAYAKLEKLVEQLETNSLPLEDSLSLFEEGQQLSAYCQQLLDKADLRVSKLAGNAGELVAMSESNGSGETKAANKPLTDTPTVAIVAAPKAEESTETSVEKNDVSDIEAASEKDDSSESDDSEEA